MTEKTVTLSLAQKKAATINDFIHMEGIVKQLNAALPKFLNADRFLRTIYSALLQNPKLLDCSKDSLLSSMIQAAQLGLEPVLGKAALIPYGNEMQFQPMFRGLIDLAMRSDKIDKITAHAVYDKDNFAIEYGTDEKLTHRPFLDGDRGNIRGSYTVWYYKDGGTTHSYMSISDIHKIRDRSQAWKAFLKHKKTCPWNTDESEMCKKTVIKRHSKLQPCSVEFEKAIEYDNALESGVSIISTVEELPATKAELLTAKIKGETPAQDLKAKLDEGDDQGQEDAYLNGIMANQEGNNTQINTKKGLSKDHPLYELSMRRPGSSVAANKDFIEDYDKQDGEIAMLADKDLRARIVAKYQKAKTIVAAVTPTPSTGDKTPERLEFEKKMGEYHGIDQDRFDEIMGAKRMNDIKTKADEDAILEVMSEAFGG